MDDERYMNDLFGDSEEVPIAPTPVIKDLPQRLDELSRTNCCQRIAWSRFGGIAAIGANGKSVEQYVIQRNPHNRQWSLSKPVVLWPQLQEGHHLVHIAFSNIGNDLTAIDSSGRFYIYSGSTALGQMFLVKDGPTDPVTDMHAIIGLHWLPVFPHTQKTGMCWSATSTGSDWNYKLATNLILNSPSNPLEGKAAFLCLTRNGVLRLLYQLPVPGRWAEYFIEIEESPLALEASFTHAAFVPHDERSLYMAVYDVSRCISVYRIEIKWNMPKEKDLPPMQKVPNPQLDVRALLFETDCLPLDLVNGVHLTQLSFLPAMPDEGNGQEPQSVYPTILAIFANTPSSSSSSSSVMMDSPNRYQNASSIICRWQLKPATPIKLYPVFDQLKISKKATSAVNPRPSARMERLSDVYLDSIVLYHQVVRRSTIVIFAMSNGSIQFRDRASMELISPDDNHDEVRSLPQAGFAFPTGEPCFHITFSPSYCAAVVMQDDGEVKLHKMEYTLSPLNNLKEDDAKFGSVAAILAMEHTSAMMQYKSTDDLLAIMPHNLNNSLVYGFVNQACIASTSLGATFDYNSFMEDNQKQIASLYKGNFFYKCLSVQNALGYKKNGIRNLPAKLSWVVINLRLVSLTTSTNLRVNDNLRSEMAISIMGIVKWSLDLLAYTLQDIFDMAYSIKGKEGDRTAIQEYIDKENSPAFLMLLCSTPRLLIRMFCRPLRNGRVHATNGYKTATNSEQKLAFSKLAQIYSQNPIYNINALETYLTDFDNLIKQAYSRAQITPVARAQIEREMFLKAEIPDLLMPVVKEMLTVQLEKLMDSSDPGKIYGHDVAWLGLTDDRRSRTLNEKHTVDAIRKMPLRPGAQLKQCARCGSVTEDLNPGHGAMAQQQQQWVWQGHKNCICYNSWVCHEMSVAG